MRTPSAANHNAMRFDSMSFREPLLSLALPPKRRYQALSIAMIASIACAALAPPWLALQGGVLAFGLSWATMIDIDRFRLPDILTLGLLTVGLAFALRDGWSSARPYIFGAAVGYLSLAALAVAYRKIRGRSGLGMGDAKLLAAAGAWLGWMALPFVVLIASLACLASVMFTAIRRGKPLSSGLIPFGPYLAAAIWIVWLLQLGEHA